MGRQHNLASFLLALLLINAYNGFTVGSNLKQHQISKLSQVIEFDVTEATCSKGRVFFQQWHDQLEEWVNILKTSDTLGGDLIVLQSVKVLIQQVQNNLASIQGHGQMLIDIKNKRKQVVHQLKKLSLMQVESDWASEKIDQIMQYVEVLSKAKTSDDKQQLVSTVLLLISQLTDDIVFIQGELAEHPDVDQQELQHKLSVIERGIQDCEAEWIIAENAAAERALSEAQAQAQAEEAAAAEAEAEAEHQAVVDAEAEQAERDIEADLSREESVYDQYYGGREDSSEQYGSVGSGTQNSYSAEGSSSRGDSGSRGSYASEGSNSYGSDGDSRESHSTHEHGHKHKKVHKRKHRVHSDGAEGSEYESQYESYESQSGSQQESQSGSERSDSQSESQSETEQYSQQESDNQSGSGESENQEQDDTNLRRRKSKNRPQAGNDDEEEEEEGSVQSGSEVEDKHHHHHHHKKVKKTKKHHKSKAEEVEESTSEAETSEAPEVEEAPAKKEKKQHKVKKVVRVKKHRSRHHDKSEQNGEDVDSYSGESGDAPNGSAVGSADYNTSEEGGYEPTDLNDGGYFVGGEGDGFAADDTDVNFGEAGNQPDADDSSSEEGYQVRQLNGPAVYQSNGDAEYFYPSDSEEGTDVFIDGAVLDDSEEAFVFDENATSFDLGELIGDIEDVEGEIEGEPQYGVGGLAPSSESEQSSGSEQLERIEEEIGQLINQVGQESAQASVQNCCAGCCNGSGQVIVVVVNDDGSSESSESSSSSSSSSEPSGEESGYEIASEEGVYSSGGGESEGGYGEDEDYGEGDGFSYYGEDEEGQYDQGESDGYGGGEESDQGEGDGYGEGDSEGDGYGEGDSEGDGYGEGDSEGDTGEGYGEGDGYAESDGEGDGYGEDDDEDDGGEFVEDFGGFTDLFGVEETSGADDDAEEFNISEDTFLDWGETDGGFEDLGGDEEGGEGDGSFDDAFGIDSEEGGEGGENGVGGPIGDDDGEGEEGESRHSGRPPQQGFNFGEEEEGDNFDSDVIGGEEDGDIIDDGEEEYNFLFFTPENAEEEYEVDANAKEVRPYELEITSDAEPKIVDAKEYSFGFWTRFRFNAEIGKVLEKPDYMGLARLTTNEQNGDLTNLGDRTLVVFIGRGYYQFTTYDLISNDVNVNYNVDYDTFLDNRWVYIYFGYKEKNTGVGQAQGFLVYDDKLVLKTELPPVLHKRVGKYIKFQGGTVNTERNEYQNFNGLMTQVVFSVNRGAFVNDENVIRALVFEKFAIKFERGAFTRDEDVLVSEEKIESDREDTEIEPHEYDNEYRYPQSYAVTLWYRYLRTKPVPWQTVFRLTTNEKEILGDQLHHGDRTLAVFQNQEAMVHFASYTVGAKDSINFIADDAILPANNVQLWTYVYFAYSGKDKALRQFLNSEDFTFDTGAKAVHYVSKYFALYLGNDGYYSPLNGKFAYVTIHFGSKAFIPLGTEVTTLKSYEDGNTKLVVHEIQDHDSLYENKEVDHSEEDQVVIEHEDGGDVLIDGVPEYGYGFWSKFMITSPKRIEHKPDMLQICRLYNRRDVTDAEKSGDRTLATFIGRGVYYFATYNWDIPNTYQTVSYGGQLDGYWNYIYFAYQKSKARATAFVIFGADKTIQRQQFANVNHDPLNKYVRFYIGKQFSHIGFNGNVAQVVLRIGPGAHISDPEPLADLLIRFPQPEQKYPIVDSKVVVEDKTEYEIEGEPSPILWDDGDAHEATEYSVSGWFKFILPQDAERKPCHLIFRLTNNHEGMLHDTDHLGDRTLATFQCTDVTFATYTIGSIDDGYLTNQFNTIQSGEYCGLWQYLYMGYSRFARRVDYFAGYPDITRDAYFTDVLHFAPKYLALYIGNDGVSAGFPGRAHHVTFRIGTGSYIDCKKRSAQEEYPLYLPFRLNNYVHLYSKTEEEALNYAPLPLDEEGNQPPAADIVINTVENPDLDIEGINEYGYGFWTRWTMAYPRRLLEKSDWHQIIRMSTTPIYEDLAKMGNRALAVFVGKGFYHFSTYDIVRDLANVYANIDYGEELEGYWNFVYFGYKRFLETPRAVGYTYFSRIKEIRRVEIPNVKHWLLRDYVKIVVGAKEFSYMPFNGRLYDLRVYFGNGGFVQSAEDLAQTTMVAFRQQPPYRAVLQTTPVLEQNMEFKIQDGPPQQVDAKFDDKFSGIFEYAISGWAAFQKGLKMQPLHSIARMTINPPNIQRDYQVAGDRTLAIFVSKTSYMFSTYDYGNLEINDDDDSDNEHTFDYGTNVMQWTFFYFGYSFHTKQAYAFVKYVNRMDSYVYRGINHFVPHYIRVFIGNDGLYPQFMGSMRSWYLGTGPAAFTLQPELLITQWPVDNIPDPDRIMSAILNNQGVNSGKLLRTGQA